LPGFIQESKSVEDFYLQGTLRGGGVRDATSEIRVPLVMRGKRNEEKEKKIWQGVTRGRGYGEDKRCAKVRVECWKKKTGERGVGTEGFKGVCRRVRGKK